MGETVMDPEFKSFLNELGLPIPEANLVDDEPPEAVDADKLRAFHRRELSGPDMEWVGFLISRYRAWHEADVRIVLAGESAATGGEKEPLSHQIRKYLSLAYLDLLGQLPLFTPAAVRADPLAPYRPALRRIVCDEWNWINRRADPEFQDPARLADAVARAIARHASEFPFPPPLLAAILVKEGLDNFCDLEDNR